MPKARVSARREADSFQAVFQAAADPMAIHDEQGRLIEVNEAALRHHGMTREELLALGPGEAEAPEFRQAIPERARRIQQQGSLIFETAHITKAGEWIPVEIHSRMIVFRGRPAILSIARDLRRRKAAEEALRQSVERFQLVVQASRDAIWDWNLKTGEIYVSPQFCDLLGYAQDEYSPSRELFESLMHPEDLPVVKAAFEAQLRGETPQEVQYRVRTKQGQYRWHLTRAVTLRDAAGVPVRMAGTSRDITEEKLIAEKLEQVQRLDSIGRLAGGIAHDFNNILTVIAGYAELLSRRLPELDPLRPIVMEILSAVERGADLSRQLLAFSRRQVLQPVVLDVNALVRNMAGLAQRLVGENIRVELNLASRPYKVLADAGQINQVLMNLIINARDAMPHGGTILLETRNAFVSKDDPGAPPGASAGDYVMIAVHDTGTGMDEETKKHVFEPFFTTKSPGSGTGLGLATVYGIVNQSGGFVNFLSQVGQGTVFRVFLPRGSQRAARGKKHGRTTSAKS